MSYPYRIRVSKAVSADVDAKDKVTQKIRLQPILDEDAMRSLLKEALKKQGFEEDEDGKLVKERETGERQVVDLESLEIETSLGANEEITKEKTLEVVGDAYARDDRERMKEKHRKEAEERLDKTLKITDEEVDAKKQDLIAKIGDQLASSQEDRTRELHEAIQEVTAEALKEKARSMGTVMSVEEGRSADGSEYELTIKITE